MLRDVHGERAADAVAEQPADIAAMVHEADALAGRTTNQGTASAPETQPSQPQPEGAE